MEEDKQEIKQVLNEKLHHVKVFQAYQNDGKFIVDIILNINILFFAKFRWLQKFFTDTPKSPFFLNTVQKAI
jgi:hypothetical protein